MGKNADIERIKLRAIFYNNIGVGLILAGVLLPYLSLYPRLGDIISRIVQIWNGTEPIHGYEWARILGGAAGMFAALYGGRRMRRWADKELTKIPD